MRNRWPAFALTLSLTIHLGVLGVWIQEQVRRHRLEERYWRSDLVGPEALAELERVVENYRAARLPLYQEHGSAMLTLGRLGERPAPEPDSVRLALDRLERTDEQLTWVSIRTGWEFSRLRKPERVQDLRRRCLEWLDSALDTTGRRSR